MSGRLPRHTDGELLRRWLRWYDHTRRCRACAQRGSVQGCGVGLGLLVDVAVDTRWHLDRLTEAHNVASNAGARGDRNAPARTDQGESP